MFFKYYFRKTKEHIIFFILNLVIIALNICEIS